MAEYNPEDKNHRRILAVHIKNNLLGMGFDVIEGKGKSEVVMGKEVVDGVFVYVYTSIGFDGIMRACGKDAIRVCAVHERLGRGLVKTARIYRTGELVRIVERLVTRVNDVLTLAVERASWNKNKPAPKSKQLLTIGERELLARIVEQGDVKADPANRALLNNLRDHKLIYNDNGTAVATEKGRKSYQKARKVFG